MIHITNVQRMLDVPEETTGIVFDVRSFERVGSTSDELRALARNGAAHGTVVCAAEQISGRGRLGRQWFSAPGNLYVSVLLRTALPAPRLSELAFVAGLAVADAVDVALSSDRHARLKWPNDVLIDGAKVAGVLLETGDGEDGSHAVILGIGVNVDHAPSGLPYPVTCLREQCGARLETTRQGVLAAVAARWDQWLNDGFGAVRADWLVRGPLRGARLRVSLPGSVVEGDFVDLDADGALLLDTASGPRRFVGGDVAMVS